MKFNLFVLPTVPATLEERERLRPIGRNTERYQQMLDELRKLAVMADDAGFDAMSTTEHHFHSEGFELSVAPLMLYTDLAARTKRIKFASLGLVLPSWDPLRVAEEIAVLDQLTKGRLCVGFARGYQDRWVNVLGQGYHATGAPMDGLELDNRNRAIFEEVYKVIKLAWTQESIRYQSDTLGLSAPYPYSGITRWPASDFTRTYGAHDEIDENGAVQRISVAPRPYQIPHPPIWQPFSVSERTIRWCGEEDILPWILVSYPPKYRALVEAYHEEAQKAGRNYALGQNVAAFRSVHFGDTYQQAFALGSQYHGEIAFKTYFSNFGFFEAFRFPEDDEKYPGELLPRSEWTFQRMVDSEYALVGTPDDIKRKVEALLKNGNAEWFGWYFDQGLLPWHETERQFELFARHIVPEFRDALQAPAATRA